MAEQNLADGLTALAEHGGRTGRLAVAADVRGRGDRRRRWRYAGSAGLGLLVAGAFGAGIALGQPRSGSEPPAAPQVPAASQPGPELPLPALPATVSPAPGAPSLPAPAVSSSSAVSVPPGAPRSPIKAPPPEYPYTGDPAVPATAYPGR